MGSSEYIVKSRPFYQLGLGTLIFYTHCSLLRYKDFELHGKMVRCGLLRRQSPFFKMTDSSKYSLLLSPFLIQLIESNASMFRDAFQEAIDNLAGLSFAEKREKNLTNLWEYTVMLGENTFHIDVTLVFHEYDPRLYVFMYYTGTKLQDSAIDKTVSLSDSDCSDTEQLVAVLCAPKQHKIQFPLTDFMEFLSCPMHINLYTPEFFGQVDAIRSAKFISVNDKSGHIQNYLYTAFLNRNIVQRYCK